MKMAMMLLCPVTALLACQNDGAAVQTEDTSPEAIWSAVSKNALKQGLSTKLSTGLKLSVVGDPITLSSLTLVKSLTETELDCPNKVLTTPLPTDELATTTTVDKYLLLESTAPLPLSAFGSSALAVSETAKASKYYVKLEEKPDERAKYIAKVLLAPKDFKFEQRWERGYDKESGSAFEGIVTRVSAGLPVGPTIEYVRTVAATVDPCW